MLLYLASELRLFKQSAVIGSNFKVKAYKKEGGQNLLFIIHFDNGLLLISVHIPYRIPL